MIRQRPYYPAPPGYQYNPNTNSYEAEPPIMTYQRGQMQTQPQYQFQYTQEPAGIPGKIIAGMQDIKVTDVPQEGRGYYPTNDGNYIVTKEWTNTGAIDTKVYQLAQPDQKQSGPSFEEMVMQRFERLEQLLMPQKPKKKEGAAGESV